MSKFIKNFKKSYQDSKWAGGELVDDVMHQVSEDIVSFLNDYDIIHDNIKVFEIGSGGCRNLRHIYNSNNNVELYANDLYKDASFKNMHEDIKRVINFLEIDTLKLMKEMNYNDIDLFMSSYHLMHIDSDSCKEIVDRLTDVWKPKHIFLNELIMQKFPGHYPDREIPRIFHDFSKLEESYELIGDRISIRDTLEPAVKGYYNFRLYKSRILE